MLATVLAAASLSAQPVPGATAPASLSAQGSGTKPAPGAAAPAPAPPAQPTSTATPSEVQGYSYNPEGRRDPFVSLVRRGADPQSSASSRAPGLSGLAASEVTLKGTIQSRTGFVALVQGVDNKTYIVRPGDKLLDGTVRTITANAMVILQQVNDPLSLEKQREVRKVLRQADEVK
jgi:type IV pilus assembly protein PilP